MRFLLTLLSKRKKEEKIVEEDRARCLAKMRHYILSHSAFLLTVRHPFLRCMHLIVLAGLAFRPKTGIVETRPHFSRKNTFLL